VVCRKTPSLLSLVLVAAAITTASGWRDAGTNGRGSVGAGVGVGVGG
jgi:hypothetical protein